MTPDCYQRDLPEKKDNKDKFWITSPSWSDSGEDN